MLDHHTLIFGLLAATPSLAAAFPAASSTGGVEGSMTTYLAPPAVTHTSPVFPGDGVTVTGSMTTMVQTVNATSVTGSMTTMGPIVNATSVTGSMTTMLSSATPTAAVATAASSKDRLGDLLREFLDQLEEVADVDNLKALFKPKKRAVEVRQTADPMPTFTNDPPTHTADPMPTFTNDPPTQTADPTPSFTIEPPVFTSTPRPSLTTIEPPALPPTSSPGFTIEPPAFTSTPAPSFTIEPPVHSPAPIETSTSGPSSLYPDPMPTIKPDPTISPRYAATPSPVLFGLPEWWPVFVSNATQSIASRTSGSAGFPTNTLPPATGVAQKTAAPVVGAVVAAAVAYYLL